MHRRRSSLLVVLPRSREISETSRVRRALPRIRHDREHEEPRAGSPEYDVVEVLDGTTDVQVEAS